ncbi:zinc-binding dehydrogenase, partial [Pseudomonas aeruginosa]
IDGNAHRLDIARGMGADVTLNFRECDVIEEILKLTGGRGVDASIEALGTQSTFETALRVLKPGGDRLQRTRQVFRIDTEARKGVAG